MAAVKLLLILVQLGHSLISAHERRQFRERLNSITENPDIEWNRRFGGMHMPTDTSAELSAAAAALAHGESGRVVPLPQGYDPSSFLYRAGGELLPTLKVKRIAPDSKLLPPIRATDGSAGFDLRAAVDLVIPPDTQLTIPTGWAVAIPTGYCGIVLSRSGLCVRAEVSHRAGLIDEDYRGEVLIVLRNEGFRTFHVSYNERIAQMVLVPYLKTAVEIVDELPDTERDSAGFGSTGVH